MLGGGQGFATPKLRGHLVMLAGNIGNDRTAVTIPPPGFESGTFSPIFSQEG